MADMRTALIGHSGLVGSTLLRQTTFDDCYRSTNIEQIRGRSYDLLVCAGAPAEKWRANQEPERDRENIERLMTNLAAVNAKHVVLISTVDVYAVPVAVDENSAEDSTSATAYGRHRFALEQFVRSRFDTTCLRLPGLFGYGLKKNIIFDLLNANNMSAMCAESMFQFYPLHRLWADVTTARAHQLGLMNLAVEPVSVRDVARVGFGIDFQNPAVTRPARYDMRTIHAPLFGGRDGYLLPAERVLAEIGDFVQAWRRDHA